MPHPIHTALWVRRYGGVDVEGLIVGLDLEGPEGFSSRGVESAPCPPFNLTLPVQSLSSISYQTHHECHKMHLRIIAEHA